MHAAEHAVEARVAVALELADAGVGIADDDHVLGVELLEGERAVHGTAHDRVLDLHLLVGIVGRHLAQVALGLDLPGKDLEGVDKVPEGRVGAAVGAGLRVGSGAVDDGVRRTAVLSASTPTKSVSPSTPIPF